VLAVPSAAGAKEVVSAGMDRTVRVWDAAAGAQKRKLGPTPDDPFGLALSPDGKAVAVSGYGGHLHVWSLADAKPVLAKKLKTFGGFCIAFTPDGKAVVTGHADHACYFTP